MMNKRFRQSIHHAVRGIRYVVERERNFRIQLCIGAMVLGAAFVLSVERSELIVLLFLIVGVLLLEILNSAFEACVDILKPRLSYHVEIVKDTMAGAVLIMSLAAALIGSMIFFPYIVEFVFP